MTYGTGRVSGTIVQDTVVIAGLPLANHAFGVASQESIDFSSNRTPFDGLMGLAKSVRIGFLILLLHNLTRLILLFLAGPFCATHSYPYRVSCKCWVSRRLHCLV